MARSQTDALFVGSENVVRATTMTDILAAFVQATALKNLDRASLLFFDKPWQDKDTPPESITATATWGIDDSIPLVDVGTTFPFAAFPGTQFLNRDIPNVIDDVLTNPRIDEGARRLFSEGLGVRSVIIIPLVAGDQWIGFVFGLSEYMYHMKENDIRQIMSLAGQAATVAQSQRLYQEASTRAEREQILRQVSDRVYAAPDAETVLRTAAREIGQALGLETYIYLENELTGDETLLTTK
ncbi:MAG: GAF domain-containing protein [Anaerolineae bacterium]|nr:GAF domain-containing protein [Anaerolineae bacterium]